MQEEHKTFEETPVQPLKGLIAFCLRVWSWVLHGTLMVQLCAVPVMAAPLTPDPEKIYEIPTDHYAASTLPKEETEMLEKLVAEPVQVTLELMALMRALGLYVQRLESVHGKDNILERITSRHEKREISITIDGVGKAELKALGVGNEARVFTRIVHFKTQNSYLFLNYEEISMSHLEKSQTLLVQEDYDEEVRLRKYLQNNLRQYIARQLLAAGSEQYAYETLDGKNFNMKDFVDSLPIEERASRTVADQVSDELEDLPRRQRLLRKAWELLFEEKEKEAKATQLGRDTIVVWYHHKGVEKDQKFKVPASRLSMKFWKEYWHKIWEKPQFNEVILKEKGIRKAKVLFSGDFALAIGSASAQGLAALGLAYGFHKYLGQDMSYVLPTLSLIWGGVIGVFNKTYRNIVYDGSHLAQTIKGWMVSLSFSYTYVIVTQGLGSVVGFSAAVLEKNFHIFSNNLLTNWAKTWWNQFTRIRVLAGELLDDFQGKVSPERLAKIEEQFKRYRLGDNTFNQLKAVLDSTEKSIKKAKIEKAGVSSQTFYLGSFILKLGDLVETRVAIPGFGENVPLGRIAFVLSIPLVRWAVIKYAEAHNAIVAPELRREWENDKLMGIPYLNFLRKKFLD